MRGSTTLCAMALLLALSATALASNGMNMIGSTTRGSGMAGADVAMEGDCSGAAVNPATMGTLSDHALSVGLSVLHPPIHLKNGMLGPNDLDSEDQYFPIPFVAYSRRLGEDSPWTVGMTVYGQGGLGVKFEDVQTFAGTRDGFESDLQFVRLSPTTAYRVNDHLTVGASLLASYARMKLSLFPNTYTPGMSPGPEDDFVGVDLDDISGLGVAGRAGLLYRVCDQLSIGVTYTSETAMDLGDGDLTMNLGMARATYDADVEDFTFPQEAEIGVAVRPLEGLTVAADARWINWSDAVEDGYAVGRNPNLPLPPEAGTVRVPFNTKWDDQWVFAVGLEYALNERHVLRCGYNYGENPVPDRYATPLFPVTVEEHVTVGYGLTGEDWRFDVAYERSFEISQDNTNPNPMENPFGPDATITAEAGQVIHLAVTRWF